MKTIIKGLLIASIACSGLVIANEKQEISTLRNATKIEQQKTPNKMYKVENTDIKQARNYPMQPPIIPHTIRNYEVNLNTNKCMSCHSRTRTGESQAPMVSVTHFMDRDGNFLAEISPRRYFCSQCHVTQQNAKPLVDNTFVDMHQLMKAKSDSQ
ncbi:nitrate reductase cytochrome c-type subunit [Thalassotalea sp. LPB0316]|uniref:nitrate reductase cytochrome c-type subunit n=1 Tax=Thalassotalea sp. LPB0316 TaxID=2769490 RepID=UPI0018691C88|nr:nitrate reductase cytochrome c-type subunit [Thalassotalea sp. LPB0316]QOL26962.1 nitrate reductase cytochrome c-type subunit [Thalassotalea sp. LPB0316]